MTSWASSPAPIETEIGTPRPATYVRDPRQRKLPQRHRVRLGLQSNYIQLSKLSYEDRGFSKTIQFRYTPIMVDIAYQIQFLKVLMARGSFALGPNVGNTRHAMPFTVRPSVAAGLQTSLFGLAGWFAYNVPFPRKPDQRGLTDNTPREPALSAGQAVGGELSFTSRVDRLAVVLAVGGGVSKGTMTHLEVASSKWRPVFSLTAGFFFDGKHRRARRNQ